MKLMKLKYHLVFAVVGLLILPLSANSEIKEGQFEFSPFVGYNFFENGQNLEDQIILGGRIGYNLTRRFAIEATGENIGSRVDSKAKTWTEVGQFVSPDEEVAINFYHLDLLYHFTPESDFNPFVAAGYGVANYNPGMTDGGNMSIINFGVGAKHWMSDNLALRFDVRDNFVHNENIHNIGTSIGLVFALGKKAKPAPEATMVYEEPMAEEKMVVLSFEDIPFNFDSTTLTSEAKDILEKNIQVLKEKPGTRIRISGHASLAGSAAYNQMLSEKRAEVVYNYLIEKGNLQLEKLLIAGYGEMKPAMDEPNPGDIHSKEAKSNMIVRLEIIE